MWAHTFTKTWRTTMPFTLTASMPDSCMPMLTTAMVMTCQRTERSVSRLQTETVWMEDRERCSSCISSTSSSMLPLVRYHFRAKEQKEKLLPACRHISPHLIVFKGSRKQNISSQQNYRGILCPKLWKIIILDNDKPEPNLPLLCFISNSLFLTCDGGVNISLLYQQVPWTLRKPW